MGQEPEVLHPEQQHSGLVQKGHLHGVPEHRTWPLSQHKGQPADAEPHQPVSHPSFAISSVASREMKAETLNGIHQPWSSRITLAFLQRHADDHGSLSARFSHAFEYQVQSVLAPVAVASLA